MERRQRPAQLAREIVVPALTGQRADFAFGPQLSEDRLRRPRSRLGFRVPPGPPQQRAQVPRRLGLELRPTVRLRSPDHLPQRPHGRRRLALGRQHRCRDSEILRLSDGVGILATDFAHPVQVAARQLRLAARHADLGASPQRQRGKRAVSRRFGCRDRLVGFRQRAVELSLLAIRDPEVVVTLGDALLPTGAVEGGDGDVPGPDRFGVSPPQVTDDPQIVGAAADRGIVAVSARDHEGLREVVRRFVDPPADQRDGAPCVERVTFDCLLVQLARLVQRHLQPAQSFGVAPEPCLRGPVQQREAGRLRQFAPRAAAEVLDDLKVTPGRSELPGLVDYA